MAPRTRLSRIPGHVIALLLTLCSLPQLAAAGPEGTVQLRNGGRIHGEIMEVVPQEYVSVRLADGSVRRIEWAQVLKVDEHAPAPRLAPSGAASPVPVPASLPPPAETAIVEIRSTKQGVTIGDVTEHASFAVSAYGPSGTGSGFAQGVSWRNLCMAPCRIRLTPGVHELIASGEGYSSRTVPVNLAPGVNRLIVRPGYNALWFAGATLISLSLGALVTGVTFAALPRDRYDFNSGTDSKSGVPAWVIATIAAGAAGVGGGIWMVVAGRTTIEQDTSRAGGAAARSRGTTLAIRYLKGF